MNPQPESRLALPSTVLLILGFVDLFRGTLHTFLVRWSAVTFAHLDLSQAGPDQLVLLGAFGISNLLTGMLYIAISLKAKPLAEYVLMIIVAAYAIGFAGVKMAGVHPNAAFNGKYFMLVYVAGCLVTVLISRLRPRLIRRRNLQLKTKTASATRRYASLNAARSRRRRRVGSAMTSISEIFSPVILNFSATTT